MGLVYFCASFQGTDSRGNSEAGPGICLHLVLLRKLANALGVAAAWQPGDPRSPLPFHCRLNVARNFFSSPESASPL